MIWFITLVGFWSALVTLALIIATVSMVGLSKISQRFFGCAPFTILLLGSSALLIGLTVWSVPQNLWNPTYNPAKIALDEFVLQLSPSLHQKIQELRAKETETADKIRRFKKLKRERSNFAATIDIEIAKWQRLNESIRDALDLINQKTEAALVDYEIDEIAGRKKFSNVSREMLADADSVLGQARVLQNAVEKNSNSKNDEPENELSTIEKLLKEMD